MNPWIQQSKQSVAFGIHAENSLVACSHKCRCRDTTLRAGKLLKVSNGWCQSVFFCFPIAWHLSVFCFIVWSLSVLWRFFIGWCLFCSFVTGWCLSAFSCFLVGWYFPCVLRLNVHWPSQQQKLTGGLVGRFLQRCVWHRYDNSPQSPSPFNYVQQPLTDNERYNFWAFTKSDCLSTES